MTPTPEIINPRQAHILTTIRKLGGSAIREQIRAAAEVSNATINRVMESLKERELVTTTPQPRPRGPRVQLISITPLGRRALAGDKVRRAKQALGIAITPPPRIVVAIPVLPVAPYYRNNGNVHIASHGQTRC